MLSKVVPFVLRGTSGYIRVQLAQNPDPKDWMESSARQSSGVAWDRSWLKNFPTCTAIIDHPAVGYAAMCGWIQLVRSSDSESDVFEMDPTPITAGLDLPYCWFGTKPTLFDGPSRDSHANLDWCARSFLCASPHVMSRTVVPIAAFEWGFQVRDESVLFRAPEELSLATWDSHAAYLKQSHPAWSFAPASAHDDLASGPAGPQ
jgi:hypothetical protein